MKPKTRSILIRIAALVVLIVIAIVMMRIGRGHTVLYENGSFEYDGKSYEGYYKITAYDGDEKIGSMASKPRAERAMTTNIGQSCSAMFEVIKEKGDEPVYYEANFKLPYGMDGILINVPAYLEGLSSDAYLSEFFIEPPEEEEEEEPAEGEGMPSEDLGLGEG